MLAGPPSTVLRWGRTEGSKCLLALSSLHQTCAYRVPNASLHGTAVFSDLVTQMVPNAGCPCPTLFTKWQTPMIPNTGWPGPILFTNGKRQSVPNVGWSVLTLCNDQETQWVPNAGWYRSHTPGIKVQFQSFISL